MSTRAAKLYESNLENCAKIAKWEETKIQRLLRQINTNAKTVNIRCDGILDHAERNKNMED